MSRAIRWLSGFAPMWLAALLLNLDALHEMNDATQRQVTR